MDVAEDDEDEGEDEDEDSGKSGRRNSSATGQRVAAPTETMKRIWGAICSVRKVAFTTSSASSALPSTTILQKRDGNGIFDFILTVVAGFVIIGSLAGDENASKDDLGLAPVPSLIQREIGVHVPRLWWPLSASERKEWQ
jgi:hypothetical protein